MRKSKKHRLYIDVSFTKATTTREAKKMLSTMINSSSLIIHAPIVGDENSPDCIKIKLSEIR